jgi:site-specific recombinase XerD
MAEGKALTAVEFRRRARAAHRPQLLANGRASSGLGSPGHQGPLLRYACGYTLADAGHDTRSLQAYLGHRNIQNTTRHSALAPDRFKGFWKD